MKNFVPFLTIVGISTLLISGCEGNLTKVNENKSNCANEMLCNAYAIEKPGNQIEIANKYNLTVEMPNEDIDNLNQPNNQEDLIDNQNSELTEEYNETTENCEDCEEISTLYSLSEDIEDGCNIFCDLKERLKESILETRNLITKLNNNEISLTDNEKLVILDQAKQLKDLSKMLASTTTELSINLSNIYNVFNNTDDLSIKYLLVLDNLINGNEMLEASLNSLNTIKTIFALNSINNQTNLTYGYQKNNEQPIIENYLLDENGNVIKNQENNEVEEVETKNEMKNIDTYQNNMLNSNIDTFGNRRNNIDTFFNTAWLDNNFMYGAGGINNRGFNGFGYGYPNNQMFNKTPEQNDVATSGVDNSNNTQHNKIEKQKRKFKLEKNIDTYRNENTPTVSAKLTFVKDFFKQFKGDNNLESIKEKLSK